MARARCGPSLCPFVIVDPDMDDELGDCEADDAREPLAEELVSESEPDVDDFRNVGTF